MEAPNAIKLSLGRYGWAKVADVYGYNADIDIATEDVWPTGGDFVIPSTTAKLSIASSNAQDNPTGTGARTLVIEGLDANYSQISETIAMNGVTPVLTANAYAMFHRARVMAAGSDLTNSGIITFTSQALGTPEVAQIPAQRGQSANAIYQVPAGHTLLILNINASAITTGACQVDILVKPFGMAWQTKGGVAVNSSGSTFVHEPQETPFVVEEKSIIKLRCQSTANNSIVHANYAGILIDNARYKAEWY